MMRKLMSGKIKEIVESYGRWLRGEEGGEYVNLRNANLEGVDLEGANLSYADLEGANLRYTNLEGADLSNANLKGVDLSNANLRVADLSYANLRYANLEGADLSNAYLSGASLDKAYYQINGIGRRKRITTYNATDDIVLCGCWNGYKGGTLEEFRKRVESVYGKNGETPNKQYYAEYIAAIEFLEKMRELQRKSKK